MTDPTLSKNFHRVEPSRWPKDKDSIPVYKDDLFEVVQSSRSLKFFYRFYVRYRMFCYYTFQTDLTYLMRLRKVREEIVDKLSATLAKLDIPTDVLPAEPKQLKNEGS